MICFVIWLIADGVRDNEPLVFNPVNVWTVTLVVVIALDLGAENARPESRRHTE